jgi:molybdopterin molybdotransferase
VGRVVVIARPTRLSGEDRMTSGGGDEGMIDVDAARGAILAGIAPLPAVENTDPRRARPHPGRGIVAAEDIPPFRNSAMDGYAVRAADLAGASRATPTRLRVVAEGPAGYAPRGG